MFDIVIGIIAAAFVLLAQMAPYMLIGIVAAGAIHVILPESWVANRLGGPGIWPVVRAALYGVPLPLCSCGVVPVAASLKKSGAKNGATVSFLITTPTSGVDSILATYSLLGPLFAVSRVAASFVIGLFAGIFTLFLGDRDSPEPKAHPHAFARPKHPITDALRYGFGELLGGMTKSLMLGTLLGGMVAYFVPPDSLQHLVGEGVFSYLIMMVFGVPLYVCASGSIPLAAALLAKGLSPGAALVFLIAGPATNAATMGVILQFLGKRALMVFLSAIALGAVVAGMAMDGVVSVWPAGAPTLVHHHDTLALWEIGAGILLGGMLLYHLLKPSMSRFWRRRNKKSEADMKIVVPDMNCNHCSGTITKVVSKLEGVQTVSADPATKIVAVEGGDLHAVLAAIEEAGFSPSHSE